MIPAGPVAPAGRRWKAHGTAATVSVGPALVEGAVARVPLAGHDGRSGARIERVGLADGSSVIVKRGSVRTDVTMRLSGDSQGRELCLWSAGVLDRLPPTVGHTVLGGWQEGADAVVVMRDLGDAVIGWETPLGREGCRRIFAAAAAVHSAFAGASVAELCSLETRLSLFTPFALRSLPRGQHPIVDAALRGWERFADLVPTAVGEAVSALHRDPQPLAAALARRGTTLVHGDLWPVNIALEPGRVVILDWGLATQAHGAFDFATFLMGASGVGVAHDDLLDDVRAAQGDGYDETALRLALLAAVVDLGWNKALDACEHADPAVRERERRALAWWVAQAQAALELGLL